MKIKKKNLFLPIEFKYREFLSKIFFLSYAIKLGFRVYIGSSESIFRLIKSKKKRGGIFFFKGGLEPKPLENLKKKCDSFVVLDEELGTVKKDFAKTAKGRIWPDTEKFIDRYYVIGKYGFEASKNIFPKLKKNIRCTGWPRVDLWRKENDFLFKKDTQLIKKKYGNFILFSSDFGYNSKKIIKQRLKVYQNSEWKSKRKQYILEKERAKKTFEEFNYFKKLFEDYDKIKGSPLIIIRPHPAEDIEAWHHFAKNINNVKVVYEGETTPWINASSGIIHRGCSAAIQGHMRGLPIGFYVTKNAKINETPYKISKHIYSLKQLITFCSIAIKNTKLNRVKYHEEFKKMIYVKKNKFASELIAKDLLKLKTNKELTYKINLKDQLFDIFLNFKIFIKKVIKFFFKIEDNLGVVPPFRKIPGGITHQEVKNFLFLIEKNKKIKVKKIFKDCLEIE